tara:strand:- start:11 stop:310 length:300 start_codon:yes stop_codon:yes gene_type:complete
MPWKKRFYNQELEFPIEVHVDGDELSSANTQGEGGYQSLIKDMQNRVDDEDGIELDADDIERILRYAYCYGNGGWEGQLSAIFPSDVWDFSEYHYCEAN